MQGTHLEPNSIQIGWMRVNFAAASSIFESVPLSATDSDRAGRFKRPEDRLRFVLGRALLGRLLEQAGLPKTHALQLALTEQGKPYLPEAAAEHFSITHAGEIVAVARTCGAQVGVDVEQIDRPADLTSLAARIFNASDLARFKTVAQPDRPRAFFRAWTGKEAVLKAQGVGLFGGLKEIAVPFHNDAALLPAIQDEAPWILHPLQLPDGYIGRVACDDPARQIHQREFTWPQVIG